MKRLLDSVINSGDALFILGFIGFGLVIPLFVHGREFISLGLVSIVGILFSGLMGGLTMLFIKHFGDRIMK